jgi:2-polyprenyl-3-methyl-5-hydroxy-6-metoxy-1,4-benzoquinol methylase
MLGRDLPGCLSARIHFVSSDATRDHWAEWVLARGHATDVDQRAKKLKELAPIRDRVLANARIQSGDVVLDVGTGDGLIAFGAIDLVGSGRVILSDISQDLLGHDRELALGLGVAERAEFVRATAQDLSSSRRGRSGSSPPAARVPLAVVGLPLPER